VNDLNSCHFCGRTCSSARWTTHLESYRMLRSPWDAESSFLSGAFHHSCLRASRTAPHSAGRPPPVYFT